MTSRNEPRTTEILSGETVWAQVPEVLEDILAEIDEGPPAASMWRWVPVAALLVVVVVVGGIMLNRPDPIDFTLAGTSLAPGASADVRVVETPAGVVLRLEVAGLDPAAPGTYYQGWVLSGDSAVSVGTFHMRGGDGSVAFWSGVDPEAYSELIVTLQDEEGGPARSDRVVMTGRA
jgi:hypothetical protein